MRHLYQVNLLGLYTAISMILHGYAKYKMIIKNITFSQNVYLRLVEEMDMDKKMIKRYRKIFMLPMEIDPKLLPFTIVVQTKEAQSE